MSRGFKRNESATERAYATRRLLDKKRRSFISLPKRIEGESDFPRTHLILYGKDDKAPIRAEIFRRNREERGGISGFNHCWKCDVTVSESTHGYNPGEWHHLRNKSGERCDCPENGVVSCAKCHKSEHPQVRWSKNESVKV